MPARQARKQSPRSHGKSFQLAFISHLPVPNEHDAIQVVVCKLSKRPCYIPTHKNVDAKESAKLMFVLCFKQYGIPSVIISDRGSRFTSDFWSEWMCLLGVKVSMTAAYRA